MEISGAKALVTGGSEGIGRAIAEALVAAGAEVAINARRRDVLDETAAAIGALALPGDVSVEADAIACVRAFVARFGRIDILVNNAGVGYHAPLVDVERARFDALLAVNVTGAMLMAREAARHFIRQRSGHLVNISSTSGLKGDAGATAYAASKFALRGMTECWRAELRRHDVRVMLVNPSEVLTGFSAKAGGRQQASAKKLRPKEIADAVLGALRIDDRGFIPELSVFATNPF
ncbi:MAG: SDR family oxidoreductase [Planctomycetes bacterium]|nr:SDR family oxidoreductase [Planctomycetota bacterium]